MKCQCLFSGKKLKKKIINLPSAEFAQSSKHYTHWVDAKADFVFAFLCAINRGLFHMFIYGQCKNVSLSMCGQQSPKSACVSAQSDQGLHFLLTELLDTIGGMNEEQMPG